MTLVGFELADIFFKSWKNYTIVFKYQVTGKEALHAVSRLFDDQEIMSYLVKEQTNPESGTITYHVSLIVRTNRKFEKNKRIAQLQKLPGVRLESVE